MSPSSSQNEPVLQWSGKETVPRAPALPLHVHELIDAEHVLGPVLRREGARELTSFDHGDWGNRLILGDSLPVMRSLLEREGMAGKVQMAFVDPPYGIGFSSDAQPMVDTRRGGRRGTHQVKAYSDTWQRGIHSWLSHLRDRLVLVRELLAATGSVFVQIGDDNLHYVRCVMDEVFGRENFCMMVQFQKTGQSTAELPPAVCDHLVWYAREKGGMKVRRLYRKKTDVGKLARDYAYRDARGRYRLVPLNSQHPSRTRTLEIELAGGRYHPGAGRQWSMDPARIPLLYDLGFVVPKGNALFYKMYAEWSPLVPLTNMWDDTARGEFGGRLTYSVQTVAKVVERCLLMTTEPGDLVLDPTCGSGTTAWCAEAWGRRWIACDTSRLSLAVTRQRLVTSPYAAHALAEPERGPVGGFVYRTAPRITLERIAKNEELPEIHARFRPELDAALARLRATTGLQIESATVPEEPEPGWSAAARTAWKEVRTVLRERRLAVDAAICEGAPQIVMHDKPRAQRGVVRLCGPFRVESIHPFSGKVAEAGALGADVPTHFEEEVDLGWAGRLTELEPTAVSGLAVTGELHRGEAKDRAAVAVVGPLEAAGTGHIDAAEKGAIECGADVLIVAGYVFGPEAQAAAEQARVPVMLVHLLPESSAEHVPAGRLRVVRSVDLRLQQEEGETCVDVRGLAPVDGKAAREEVAAWLVDTDFDGSVFRVDQAYFPGDERAFRKLLRKVKCDLSTEELYGFISRSFRAGRRMAVKLIDAAGHESVRVVDS